VATSSARGVRAYLAARLARLPAQKPWIVPIPGTRSLERLNEDVGEMNVELTTDDLGEIREAMSQIAVVGDRY
jgi:aryl-alcohol dehydrogenase-like predicted oxidoreductase